MLKDQTSDPMGVDLVRFDRTYGLPDFVKQADQDEVLEKPTGLHVNVFADVAEQLFPCHTKAATWVHYAHFCEQRAGLDPKRAQQIEQRFREFGHHHAIMPQMARLRAVSDANAKKYGSVLADDDYLQITRNENGTVDRRCRLANSVEVKAAADWLIQYRDHFPFDERSAMATKILERADRFGTAISHVQETLEKMAGHGLPLVPRLRSELQKRAELASGGDEQSVFVRESLKKLAGTLQSLGPTIVEPGFLDQFSRSIDQTDREMKWTKHYSTGFLSRPEEVAYGLMAADLQKVAAAACQLQTGNVYDHRDFSRLKLADVRDTMGQDFAKEIATGLLVDATKMAAIASTLPRDDAELLDRLLADEGIHPMAKQAADQPQRFTPEQLLRLAGRAQPA